MLDVEPLIVEELERLAAAEPRPAPDWAGVLRRAGGGTPRRKLLVLAVAATLALVIVVAALAAAFGGFDTWLRGEPGKPASQQAQAAFERSTRSWRGFPRSTRLRQLIATSQNGARYTLYGFRGAGSLCLRLQVSGNLAGSQLACAPLDELQTRRAPALVLASDLSFGRGPTVAAGPLALPTSRAAVSFGVVADGVDRIDVTHQAPAPTRTLVAGDAFLAITPNLSPFNATIRITATAGHAHAHVPFAKHPTPFLGARPAALPAAAGPSKVDRVVRGGAIRWFARRQPRGQPVPRGLHQLLANQPGVQFARMLAPDPRQPERIVVSISPAGKAYFGGRLHNNHKVCAELVGGRYQGDGCWPAGRLFSVAPFAWTVTVQPGGQQVAISGVASDQVAAMALYPADGQRAPVALHDNTYLALGSLADYPLRLVAYDQQGHVIGIATFKGDFGAPPRPTPAPGAPWHELVHDRNGAVYTVRSTNRGSCAGYRTTDGSVQIACDQTVRPTTLLLSTGTDQHTSFLLGRAGRRIARLRIHLHTGRILTATPTRTYVLRRLPLAPGDPSAGVALVEGLDRQGRVLKRERFRR